jgi:hypothetical protein
MVKKSWATELCLNGPNGLHMRETVWKMMTKPVRQEQPELKSRPKMLQHWCMPTTLSTNEVASAAAAVISHGTCHNILSDDLNMPRLHSPFYKKKNKLHSPST